VDVTSHISRHDVWRGLHLRARVITGVFRVGKAIVFRFTDGTDVAVSHGMSGYWDADDSYWCFNYVEGRRVSTEENIVLELPFRLPNEKGRTIRFHDDRRFGRSSVGSPVIGPEVLLTQCNPPGRAGLDLAMFSDALCSRRPVKVLLMDPKVMAGVGNIYASEALWRASVHPQTPGHKVSPSQVVDLFRCVGEVLVNAIDRNLSYSGIDVYRRETCPRCSTTISQVEVGGRSSYFCPTCQPL